MSASESDVSSAALSAYRTLFDPSLLDADALPHEHDVLISPYSVKAWFSYISYLSTRERLSAPSRCIAVLERAVAALPSSFKLWNKYVNLMRQIVCNVTSADALSAHATSVHFRAARSLPHCPSLWESAISWLISKGCWTKFRPTLDEAVRALPITLHPRLWRFAITQITDKKFGELKAHILARANMLLTSDQILVDYFRTLRDIGKVDQAVTTLSSALCNGDWGGESRGDLWMELVDVIARNPQSCVSVDVLALVRGAIDRAEAEVGELWVALAEIHTRKGQFNLACAVYEEALNLVMTVHDFAVVFDSYAKFLEALITEGMDDSSEDGSSEESENSQDSRDVSQSEDFEAIDRKQRDKSPERIWEVEDFFKVESLMKMLEELTTRRPLLLSNVWLRQNPHNVHEWHKRAKILRDTGDLAGAVQAYTDSVRTVDPWQATHGRPHTLWLAFARMYENATDPTSARKVFDKAVSDPEKFKSAEDLATVWCDYAEMELRLGSVETACAVLQRATTKPTGFEKRKIGRSKSRQNPKQLPAEAAIGVKAGHIQIVHEYDLSSPAWLAWKSYRVWAFLADLRESLGSVEESLQVHERMLDSGIATVQSLANAVSYLESKRLFEQAFRLLDRGTKTLSWPHSKPIWVLYLRSFVRRYGSQKVERARDLFETAIREATTAKKSRHGAEINQFVRTLYLMYIEFEERHGLARRSMLLHQRAAKSAVPEHQAAMYRLFVVKACELFGVTRAREVYEDAIESLTKNEHLIEFSQRYALMETRMGEIDRARAIYAHGAQVADPRGGPVCTAYWAAWNAFELEHGTEDTFRDMLRTKRTVLMQNAGVHLLTPVAVGAGTVEAAAAAAAGVSSNTKGMGMDERNLDHRDHKDKVDQASHELQTKATLLDKLEEQEDRAIVRDNTEEIPLDLSSDDDKERVENETQADSKQDAKSSAENAQDVNVHQSTIGDQEADETGSGVALEITERPLPRAITSTVTGTHDEAKAISDKKEESPKDDSGPGKAGVLIGAKERLKRRRQNL